MTEATIFFPWMWSNSSAAYERDVLELGVRVALALDDPMQTTWALWEEEPVWTIEKNLKSLK
jgi:hypothetical protein